MKINVHKIILSARTVTFIVSLLFMLVYNHKVWSIYFSVRDISGIGAFFEVLTFGLFLFFLLFALLSVFAYPYLQKILLSVILLSSSIAIYFSNELDVYFDADMIANVFETDYREATELIVFPLVTSILLYGVLPALFLWRIKIDYFPFRKQILQKGYCRLYRVCDWQGD